MQFNERDILTHAGKVAMEVAKQLAEDEYDKFRTQRLTEEAKEELDTDVDSLRKRIDSDQDKQDDSAS